MTSSIHYSFCPVCGSSSMARVLTATDYTVSHKQFEIWQCSVCSLRFTQDVPPVEEIGAYYKSENYISHTNSSKGLINRLYQLVRTRTLRQKRNLVCRATGLSTGVLLDIGSGTGAFANEMQLNGWQVTGLEPDPDARNAAQRDFGFTLHPIENFYSCPSNSFDAISLWHVLEHVHDLQGYIARFYELLKPHGRLIIAVPNYTSFDARQYNKFWAAYDVPRHLYHFSPAAMQVLVDKHNMQIEKYLPMWFDSFYVSLLSSRYKNGSTDWSAATWTALWSNLKALNHRKKCSSVIYIVRKTDSNHLVN